MKQVVEVKKNHVSQVFISCCIFFRTSHKGHAHTNTFFFFKFCSCTVAFAVVWPVQRYACHTDPAKHSWFSSLDMLRRWPGLCAVMVVSSGIVSCSVVVSTELQWPLFLAIFMF